MPGKIGRSFVASLLLCSVAFAQSSPPLWGHLVAGHHAVGFRTLAQSDISRTWQNTRDFNGAFTPDTQGRPVLINAWYPARTGSANALNFSAYLEQPATPEFAAIAAVMQARISQNVESAVAGNDRVRLRSVPVFARKNAAPAAGRFPLVLYFGGLNSDINANAILGEYLASHGYVFASISLVGATSDANNQSRDPDGSELAVRDMEFALGVLVRALNADPTRLATMGHSLGGVDALVLAARNGNVRAAIGLDGTYGFEGSSQILSGAYGFEAARLRVPVLDLRRANGEQQASLDPTAIASLRHSPRSVVLLRHVHHSDFTGFAAIADEFGIATDPRYADSGWDRQTARRGFESVCEIVRAFLDRHVLGATDAAQRMNSAVERAGGTQQELADLPAPLSPNEALALNGAKGAEVVRRWLLDCAGDTPDVCVDAQSFNTAGYELLGKKRPQDALVLFELVVWAHPASANANDSLADAWLAQGDRERAFAAIRRAIELAPADPSLDDAQRARFIEEERQRLKE